MDVTDRVVKAYSRFEKLIVCVLLVLLAIMVTWGTVSLAAEIVTQAANRITGQGPAQADELNRFFHRFYMLREVFGGFMLILIGVELMKTVVTYLDRRVLHEEVVFTVAIIAVARHAISVDLGEMAPMSLIGTGVLVLGLTLGYFYFRKAGHPQPDRHGAD